MCSATNLRGRPNMTFRRYTARPVTPARRPVHHRPRPANSVLIRGSSFFLVRDDIACAVDLLLEVGDNTLQERDHALAPGLRRGAPLLAARALVRDLELQSGQGCSVVVRALFSSVLMCEDVPTVLRANRNAGSFRSASGTALGHGISDLPQVGVIFFSLHSPRS